MKYPVIYIVRDLRFNTLFKTKSLLAAERFALRYCEKRSEIENRDQPIFLIKTQLLKAYPEYQNEPVL